MRIKIVNGSKTRKWSLFDETHSMRPLAGLFNAEQMEQLEKDTLHWKTRRRLEELRRRR